jgi:DNA gyrase/topoisomerase IV subunit A
MSGKKVVENVPLIKLVETFVDHRKDVLTRKFNAELDKNNRRLHKCSISYRYEIERKYNETYGGDK